MAASQSGSSDDGWDGADGWDGRSAYAAPKPEPELPDEAPTAGYGDQDEYEHWATAAEWAPHEYLKYR